MEALALILSLRLRVFAAGRKTKALAKFQIQRQGNTSPGVTVASPGRSEHSCMLQFCPAQNQLLLGLQHSVLHLHNTTTHTAPDLLLPLLIVPAPGLQFLYLSLCYCFMFGGAGNGFTFFEKHSTPPISDHLLGTAVTEAVQIK